MTCLSKKTSRKCGVFFWTKVHCCYVASVASHSCAVVCGGAVQQFVRCSLHTMRKHHRPFMKVYIPSFSSGCLPTSLFG